MAKGRLTTKIAALAAALWLGGCLGLGGCAVFESGPLMMKQTGDMVGKVMDKALDQLQISQMTASAGASVNDPRFRVHGFFGTGVRYEMYVELIGADMTVSVAAAGVGASARNVENPRPTGGNPPSGEPGGGG